jgi:hypothetical protein
VAKELDCGDYVIYIVDGLLYLAYPDEEGNATITLKIALEDIKKIDKKYLPEGVGYKGEGVLYENTFVNVGGQITAAFPPILIAGETYKIIWNGTEYSCEGIDSASLGEPGSLILGNLGAVTGEGETGEPFVILTGYGAGNNGEIGITPLDGSTSVNISIIGKGIVGVPQQYVANAFPFHICLWGDPENLNCVESVEKLTNIYVSGRNIDAHYDSRIYPLTFATIGDGRAIFNFQRVRPYGNKLIFETIVLSPNEDGSYNARISSKDV